jgi:hypothetical protein
MRLALAAFLPAIAARPYTDFIGAFAPWPRREARNSPDYGRRTRANDLNVEAEAHPKRGRGLNAWKQAMATMLAQGAGPLYKDDGSPSGPGESPTLHGLVLFQP